MFNLKIKKRIYLMMTFIFIMTIFMMQNINASTKEFENCVNDNIKKQKTSIAKVEVLKCDNQNITEIPSLKKYQSLKVLNLSNNNIKNIKLDITTLTKLDLSNNNLTAIDNSIFDNSRLEILTLSGNMIYSIHSNINKLNNLKILELSSMHIVAFPTINSLTKLESLNIENNQLMTLPSLKNLPIESLNVTNNFLKDKSIVTKKKSFNVEKQRTLQLKYKTVKLNKVNKMFTMQEILQREVVSNEKIPLFGVKYYNLINGVDSKGKKININDYIDVVNNKVKKNGNFNANILIQTPNNDKVVTNLVVEVNIPKKNEENNNSDDKKEENNENENNNSGNREVTITQSNSDLDSKQERLEEKTTNDSKNKLEEEFDNHENKEFSDSEALKFFQFNNLFMISSIIALVLLIPLIILFIILYRSKKAVDDVRDAL